MTVPPTFHRPSTAFHRPVFHPPYTPGAVEQVEARPSAGAYGRLPPTAILGIDPGFGGALAWLDLAGGLAVADMPILTVKRNRKTKREIDVDELAGLIERHRPAFAVVERVGAMPGQGTSSMFAFGRGFGSILGVLAAHRVPVELVAPVTWKRTLAVPAGKHGARLRASQLLPAYGGHWRRAKDDGRAEASMLAWYGLAHVANRPAFAFGRGQESSEANFRISPHETNEAAQRLSNGDCEVRSNAPV